MTRGGWDPLCGKVHSLLAAVLPAETVDDAEAAGEEDSESSSADKDGAFSLESVPFVSSAAALWRRTPPMTQAYLAASITVTVLSALFNGNRWPEVLTFAWQPILGGLQLWRLATAFLHLGPLDVFYPLTLQFVWQHMAQLEKMEFAAPEEFLLLAVFGMAALLGAYSLLGISTAFLGHNFATYLVYIWSRKFEGTDVNFMDIVTLKSELLPWFFCLQTLVLEREVPVADLIGIAVGHLYHYLKLKNLLVVPAAVARLFSSQTMRDRYSSFRADFE